MSTIIKRKVKKPTVLHRAKKIVNSQDKSLHRSMLSHSRIATGYKKKIAALLGNNKALAYALEMAHVDLTNRDKLVVELQRKLTLQTPKRFKAKVRKVCEHLQVIVTLIQDILDDCDGSTDSNLPSFHSQTNNSSKCDLISNKSDSPSEAQQVNDVESYGMDQNLTPFVLKPQQRFMTAVDMSAILEQSALLGDENLPPILFPDEGNEVMSNITQRPKSKSRSTSSQKKSRGSGKLSEGPQKKKSSGALNVEIERNCENSCNVDASEILLSPRPLGLLNLQSFLEENSTKTSPEHINSICKSPQKIHSPRTISNDKNSVRRKSLGRKKPKKKVLKVKLPYTPKRSSERDKAQNVHFIAKKSPSRRKTFTVKKSRNVNRTFVLSPKIDGVHNSEDFRNSPKLCVRMELMCSPPKQCDNKGRDEKNHCSSVINSSANGNKKKSNLDSAGEVQTVDSAIRKDSSCTLMQEMDLTCPELTENDVFVSDARNNEVTGTVNGLPGNASKDSNNSCMQLMYGYDPLEGTSKNRKSSISLKKPKEKSSRNKLSSKVPKLKERLVKVKIPREPSTKSSNTSHKYDHGIDFISSDTNPLKKSLVPSSPTKVSISSSPKRFTPKKHVKKEGFNQNECLSDNLSSNHFVRTLSSSLKKKLSNHTIVNKPNKEEEDMQCAEITCHQAVVSMSSVQPVVKLNNIWSSVHSLSSSSIHHSNFVYIPDSLHGRVLRVENPSKGTPTSGKESLNQNFDKDKEICKVTLHTDVHKMDEQTSQNIDGDNVISENTTRKRRGTQVSYKEPSLVKKLRQGDPFTSGLDNGNKAAKRAKERKSRSCTMKKAYFEEGTSDSERSEEC